MRRCWSSSLHGTTRPNWGLYLKPFSPCRRGGGVCFAVVVNGLPLRVRRSAARWWGALGPQGIECPAAGAFDGQGREDALSEFAAAGAASDFIHCKPVSTVETSDRLAALCTGWRALSGLQASSACSGLGQVLAHLAGSPVFYFLSLC